MTDSLPDPPEVEPEEKGEGEVPESLPETLEEAINCVIARMHKDDQKKLAGESDRSLIGLHFILGMQIRNAFGLWGENNGLLQDILEKEPKGRIKPVGFARDPPIKKDNGNPRSLYFLQEVGP